MNRLLQTFGKDILLGYDIGCRFGSTVRRSSLAPLAESLNLKCGVGLFHGHAHNRLCQTSHLGTYVKGMGLEDLETAERLFSRSNALASTTRHSSAFHRREAFSDFFAHLDRHDTYEMLSKYFPIVIRRG